MLERKSACVVDIEYGSDEAQLFKEMTQHPDAGIKVIGDGEAASISIAKYRGCILASNNLKDICYYVTKYQLEYVTTADFLYMAVNREIILIETAEEIWGRMIQRKRKLPFSTFSEYFSSIHR